MKDLAPHLTRKRLLIEGFYSIDMDKEVIGTYFAHIISSLGLKTYGDPIIFSPEGAGKKENQGYDAFVPLIDSGISLYIWSNAKFFSIILYTCKNFDETKAIQATKDFFKTGKVETMGF